MQGEPQGMLQDRDKLGRYRPGFNPRVSKRLRVEAKLGQLVAEYFPNGGYSVMDANRLKLAAQHYFTAEPSRDAVVAQRATRVAEYLLSKLKPPVLRLPAQAPLETVRELLDRLNEGDPSVA
jgi:hypothetical protein